jgi:hypothetical protein
LWLSPQLPLPQPLSSLRGPGGEVSYRSLHTINQNEDHFFQNDNVKNYTKLTIVKNYYIKWLRRNKTIMALKVAYPQSGKQFWKKIFHHFCYFYNVTILRYHAVGICYNIDIVVFYYHLVRITLKIL